jgi:hypothetical protein
MLVEKTIKADFFAPTAQILFSHFYSTDMLPRRGQTGLLANKSKMQL